MEWNHQGVGVCIQYRRDESRIVFRMVKAAKKRRLNPSREDVRSGIHGAHKYKVIRTAKVRRGRTNKRNDGKERALQAR
jgi:hypothetical protein